jgi:hypothetical protein
MVRRNSRMNMLTGGIYAEGSGGEGTPPVTDPKPSGEGKDTPKLFTQEEVNKFLADDRRKHQANVEALKKEAEKFQGTAKEKEALQQKIQDMEKSFLTKEQLAAQAAEAAKKAHETALATTAAERDQWKNSLVKTVAETAISRAAAENKAFNPEQLSLLLKDQVEVRQKTDSNGQPIMDFETFLNVKDKDKDGNPVVLTLSVTEGVKKMRMNPSFANLFLVDGTPGTGATTINNSPVPVTSGPPSDPAQYRAWRKAQGGR